MAHRIIYDIETYPSAFTMYCINPDTQEEHGFEISIRKNDSAKLLVYLRNLSINKVSMVGFNNIGFDYVVIHKMLQKAKNCKKKGVDCVWSHREIYEYAQEIFNSQKGDDRRFRGIRDSDVIIPQIDLFLIHHFDNKARSTSLKMLEFNMRSEEIEDLPYPPGTWLNDEQIEVLLEYNKKDVIETLKFYNYSLSAIELREALTKQFGFDCTNFNDTKIGKQLFINRLEKENPGCCYTLGKYGRKMKQTIRDEIVVKDCLFDYIDFKRNRVEFQAVHEWFKSQVITETKGVFSDLLEHQLGDVGKYAEMVTKRKKINDPVDKTNKRYEPSKEQIDELRKQQPLGWVEEKELKSPKGAKSYYWCYRVADTLNVVINGFRYDFGTGGIHGAKQGTIKSTKTRKLRTLDVASYYPNMAIANSVYPKHLGKTFCKVYEDLYKERKGYDKKHPANAALKLALNGVYGDSNNQFSPLYDPAYTMSITIGGQLSLCMLMGALIDHCDAEIIMCNTDGFEYMVEVDMMDKADKIVSRWEAVTGLTMEGDTYDIMYIRDVNNYLSITESGKVKTKGAYEVLPYNELGWQKNHSAMIIPMAVYEHLIKGVDVREFILNHENEYDFFLRTKVPRSSRLYLIRENGEEVLQQNICRYYPSKEGGKLVKEMPPLKEGGDLRRLGIDTSYNVETCNSVSEFYWEKLDYDYYITEAEKLIQGVV